MDYITGNQAKSSNPLGKRLPIFIAGIVLILGSMTVYRLRQANVSGLETPIQVMPEIKTVTALGRLEPRGEIIQIAVSSGAQGNQIEELLIQEGDQVKRGDVMAILDSRDRLEAALNQAEEQVGVAIANLLNNAEVEYQRYEKLYRDGAVSASQKDSKYLTLATVKEQLVEAQANLNRIKSSQQEQIIEAKATLNQIAEVRPVDVAVAEAEVRQAQAASRVAQAELDRSYIKSPQTGRVIKILTRPGEIVENNQGIARIGETSQMYAVAEVYESDITKVQLGQTATITSSAIPGKLIGKVENIGLEIERQEVVNTDPTANIDAKVVEVKVKLDEASSQKVAGLTNLLASTARSPAS